MWNERRISRQFHTQANKRTAYINKIVCINVDYKVPKWLFANKCNVPRRKVTKQQDAREEIVAKTVSVRCIRLQANDSNGQTTRIKRNTHENRQ